MKENLYKHRFGIFLVTQLMILFGSLLFPEEFFEHNVLPVLFLISIAAGILMISKRRKLTWFVSIIFLSVLVMYGFKRLTGTDSMENRLVLLFNYFIFYTIVSFNIIKQVWGAEHVTRKVMIGLISGYISLGFLAFFLFLSIELAHPGSFQGFMLQGESSQLPGDAIMYYAYITLLTIGYGEIVPVTPIAQKAAILVGLLGQFYLVIISAVVISKYIRHMRNN